MAQPWSGHYEEGVKQEISIPDLGLFEMFKGTAERFSEHDALIFMGRKTKYTEMNQLVERLARGLWQHGLRPGDRISLYMPNSANWVISFYAIMRLGGIVVQTNPLYVEDELKAQLSDAGAKGIISVPPLLGRISAIQNEVPLSVIAIDALKAYGGKEENQVWDLSEILADDSLDGIDLPVLQINAGQDIAVLQYTGGTTGTSKGVMLTHRNLVANAFQIGELLQIEMGKEKILTVLPLFHIYALTTCMNLAMMSGSAMIILPKFDLEMALQSIHNYQPTLFPGAPTMYVAVINYPRLDEYNVSSIRACISGSAPLHVEVAHKFNELTGAQLVEGYGLSEAAPVTHVNPLYHPRVGSIGVPAPNTDAKIVDLETGDREMKPGETGELIVKGDQVMRGYWNKQEETEAVLKDGWLYTGDIAYMDEDGFFYIVDRKKDMIISGGYNIYPRDVEEVLYAHPAVKEAICAGIPHSYWGEMVKAYIVVKEGQKITEQELIDFCRQKLASYKVPKMIEIRAELPKTAVGKVLRRFLVEEEKQKQAEVAVGKES